MVAIDVVVEDARCGCRNGEKCTSSGTFFPPFLVDNGTEGGVAKHPTTLFNLETVD